MKILKKILLLVLFCLTLSTVLLTWQNIRGVQILNGTSLLSGNILLSGLIFVSYFVSVLLYEKAQKIFFISGISSLSMLFAIMVSKFEAYGRFSNKSVGPYLGIAMVVITAVIYIFFCSESYKKGK